MHEAFRSGLMKELWPLEPLPSCTVQRKGSAPITFSVDPSKYGLAQVLVPALPQKLPDGTLGLPSKSTVLTLSQHKWLALNPSVSPADLPDLHSKVFK